MKKISAFAIFAALFALVFTGCNSGTKQETSSPSDQQTASFNQQTAQTVSKTAIKDKDGNEYTVELIGNFTSETVEETSKYQMYQLAEQGNEILTGAFGFRVTSPSGQATGIEFKSRFFDANKVTMSFNQTKIDQCFWRLTNNGQPDFLIVDIKTKFESSRSRHIFYIKDGALKEIEFIVKDTKQYGYVLGVGFEQTGDNQFVDILASDGNVQAKNYWTFDEENGTLTHTGNEA